MKLTWTSVIWNTFGVHVQNISTEWYGWKLERMSQIVTNVRGCLQQIYHEQRTRQVVFNMDIVKYIME